MNAAWLLPASALVLAILTFGVTTARAKATADWLFGRIPGAAMHNRTRSALRKNYDARVNRDSDYIQLIIAVVGSIPSILFVGRSEADYAVIAALAYGALVVVVSTLSVAIPLVRNQQFRPLLILSLLLLLVALGVGIVLSATSSH